MKLGDKIRIFRTMRGYTQIQLANLSEISLSAIKKYELNTAVPKHSQLKKISDSLGITDTIFYDNKIETVGDVTALLFLLDEYIEFDFVGDKNEDMYTSKDIAIRFKHSALQEFLADWANVCEKIANIKKEAESLTSEDVKEYTNLQCEEMYNKFKFSKMDSPVIVDKNTKGLAVRNYTPPSEEN